jgi:hypothetical protein
MQVFIARDKWHWITFVQLLGVEIKPILRGEGGTVRAAKRCFPNRRLDYA